MATWKTLVRYVRLDQSLLALRGGPRMRVGSVVSLVALGIGACSSDDVAKKVLADGCRLSSECADGLVCGFGRCHKACVTSKDCPIGASCVNTSDGFAVCQLPEEMSCVNDSGCPEPLVCGVDQNCRGTCKRQSDCTSGQVCANQGLCAEPSQVDANNNLIPKSGAGGNAGGGGVAGAGTAVGGAINSTSGGAANVSGSAGASVVPSGGTNASGASSVGGAGAISSSAGSSALGGSTSSSGNSGVGGVGGVGTAGASASVGGTGNAAGGTGAVGTGGALSTSCVGRAPTYFGHESKSSANPLYTTGVGLQNANEVVVFNGYVGDQTIGAAGSAGAAGASAVTSKVNRIDIQHFDSSTGASKGSIAPLFMAEGDGSGLYVLGAAIAPTGEVAVVYSAATGTNWGTYVAFLDKDLALKQTTQIVALGLDYYHNQAYVEWLNGKFVASAVVYNSGYRTIKLAKFTADGSNAGSTSAIPTDDPTGYVHSYPIGHGEVAFSGGAYAIGFSNTGNAAPYVTIVDALGGLVGSPTRLPGALTGTGSPYIALAGTSQGFMAVYNGTSSLNSPSVLATFLSNSAAGASGAAGAAGASNAGPLGATYAFPGGYSMQGAPSAGRGTSDGTGAGFAILYPDGSVSFLYFGGDGSFHTSPQSVLQQANPGSGSDLVNITNFGGSFAISLYSGAERVTRVVTSKCE